MTEGQPESPVFPESKHLYKLKPWQRKDDADIDTEQVAKKLCRELKRLSIPQAVFAHKILCRSQGTLSDLLRNPKPWHQLKSGRETFRRMWNWLQLPESERLKQLSDGGIGLEIKQSECPPSDCSPPCSVSPVENLTTQIKREHEDSSADGDSPDTRQKRTRFRTTFTPDQRHYLNTLFVQNPKPLKHEVNSIANRLNLKPTTVANFFANARQRYAERFQAQSEMQAIDYSKHGSARHSPTYTDSSEDFKHTQDDSDSAKTEDEKEVFKRDSGNATEKEFSQSDDMKKYSQWEQYKFVLYNSVESRSASSPSENNNYTYFIKDSKEESPDEDFN